MSSRESSRGEEEGGGEVIQDALARASGAVRQLLDRAARQEVETRYAAGRILCDVRAARSTYGEHAIEQIATALNVKAYILYECAAVAENWSPEEMRGRIPRPNRYGEPLSWSHWRALTRVAATLTRRELVEQCLAEGWTVRELRLVVARRRHQATRGKNDDVSEGQSIRVALDEGRRDASRAVHALGMFVDALRTRAPGYSWDDQARREAAAALEAHETLREQADAAVQYLREVTGAPARKQSETRLRVPVGIRVAVAGAEEEYGEDGREAAERVRRGRRG